MAVQEHLRWAAEAAKVDRTMHLGGYDKPVPTMSDVVHQPVGVVAAITGYNYPLNLAIFKFGAALAAGCTVVLLPSPRTPLTTLLLGDLIQEAGLPPGVMNVVIGGPMWASSCRRTPASTGCRSPAPTASARRSWSRPRRTSPA